VLGDQAAEKLIGMCEKEELENPPEE